MAGSTQSHGEGQCQARRRAATVSFKGLDCTKKVPDSTTVGTQRLRPSRSSRSPRPRGPPARDAGGRGRRLHGC